jgi:hypothetical protein
MRLAETAEQKSRRLKKSLPFTIHDIEREISCKGGTFDGITRARGVAGTIRVIIRAKLPVPQCWAMSVLLNNARVDGIDWEAIVRDHRGQAFNCTGWHRHVWKPRGLDTHKECLKDFSPTDLREFLLGAFGVLNVELRKEDHAAGRLQFD